MFLEILFATSNKNKFVEAVEVFRPLKIPLKQFPFDYREIRSDSLEEIARDAVSAAHKRCRLPVFVEDSGLFIEALNGFPGTFSSWTLKKIGVGGILKLMDGLPDRSAYFEACIAYQDGHDVTTYRAKSHGTIAYEARGKGGFGYDSIFIPDGEHQTFAENKELKNKLSHRYKSLLEFSSSLKHGR
ncbi:MAG: XTP/dITP diphosphatase [Candidatus Micrarchaeia archaeon]